MKVNQVVTGCDTCPFASFSLNSTRWQCFHPKGNDFIANFDEELVTPTWCPLMKGEFTVGIQGVSESNKREDVMIRSILFECGGNSSLGMKGYAKIMAQEFSRWLFKNNWILEDEIYYNGVDRKTSAQLYRYFSDECLQKVIE